MLFFPYLNSIFIAYQMESHEYFKKPFQIFALEIPGNYASVQKKARTLALLF